MTQPTATTALYTASEVEARTGVPATTLRQWERRYGFPSPLRSASGYRTYSPLDLAGIAFIQARQEEGVAAGRAVELARAHFAPPPELTLVGALVEALVRPDHREAARLLAEAHATLPAEEIMMTLMQPALGRIGELWERGEITVAHEHQASAFLKARLSQMLEAAGMNEVGPAMVAACGPGEYHEIGLMMLSVVLRRRGIRVHYLGSNTPLADMALYAQAVGARALLLTVNAPDSLAQLQAQLSDFGALRMPIFYGGQMLNQSPELARELRGEYLGNSATQAATELVRRLLETPATPALPGTPAPQRAEP